MQTSNFANLFFVKLVGSKQLLYYSTTSPNYSIHLYRMYHRLSLRMLLYLFIYETKIIITNRKPTKSPLPWSIRCAIVTRFTIKIVDWFDLPDLPRLRKCLFMHCFQLPIIDYRIINLQFVPKHLHDWDYHAGLVYVDGSHLVSWKEGVSGCLRGEWYKDMASGGVCTVKTDRRTSHLCYITIVPRSPKCSLPHPSLSPFNC